MSTIEDMSDNQFQQWSRLLEERTGMNVQTSRRSFLVTSVRLRMRELGFSDYQAYYNYLNSGQQGSVEWATLVDRLTVHETRFFRHLDSARLIQEYFLPEFFAENPDADNLQIWSVGCATGEETYTLAIVLDDYLRTHNLHKYYGVIGSDISLPALGVARDGVYPQRKITNASQPYLERYFTKIDKMQYQVNAEIRKRVCFNHLNILEAEKASLGKMNIIMCQNVLIYFDQPMRHKILNTLADHLQLGGIMILGHGESLGWAHPELRRIHKFDTLAYRRHRKSKDGQHDHS